MKNLIKSIALFSFIFILSSVTHAQQTATYSISDIDIEYYTKLNNDEDRLLDYKDSEEGLLLKLQQLAHINKGRKKYKATPVKLDIFASRVANKIAEDAIDGNYMGHYNLKGESPYINYARLGGKDHIQENASSITSNAALPNGNMDILGFMQQANNAFMDEKKPNDGHKQNCINKDHNYVGLGYAIKDGQFRYYEEFVDRYLNISSFEAKVKVNQSLTIPIKAKDNYYEHMALVYFQKFPSPMSAKKINSINSYPDFTKDISHQILPWNFPEEDSSGFIPLEFTFDKKGIYYIQIYLDTKPYKTGSPASTNGKIQASGIVIEVN